MRWRSWGSVCNYLVVFLLLLPASPSVFAQQTASPSPSDNDPKAAIEAPAPAPQRPEVHRFWDRTNILLFSGIAFVRGMDYASTRNFQARGRQEILLPDEVVNNSAGFAALEAAGVMTSVGISYIFHRTGHHSLERWLSIGHIGVTSFGDVRNYCLRTRHPHVPNTGP